LALVTIALLAALVQGRQDAEDALGSAGCIRAYGDYTLAQDSVGNFMATKGAGGEMLTSRHDILRK
jgi:hypothetical protein